MSLSLFDPTIRNLASVFFSISQLSSPTACCLSLLISKIYDGFVFTELVSDFPGSELRRDNASRLVLVGIHYLTKCSVTWGFFSFREGSFSDDNRSLNGILYLVADVVSC